MSSSSSSNISSTPTDMMPVTPNTVQTNGEAASQTKAEADNRTKASDSQTKALHKYVDAIVEKRTECTLSLYGFKIPNRDRMSRGCMDDDGFVTFSNPTRKIVMIPECKCMSANVLAVYYTLLILACNSAFHCSPSKFTTESELLNACLYFIKIVCKCGDEFKTDEASNVWYHMRNDRCTIFFNRYRYTCFLHASYMPSTWFIHGSFMLPSCFLHAFYMVYTWFLHASNMLPSCFLHAKNMLSTCKSMLKLLNMQLF
jgi:hypothetical protein